MYTKENLIKCIEEMNINPKGTVMIHSSMKSIGEVNGGVDTVLDAWSEYMKDGLLVFPTHTWKDIPSQKKTYNVTTEPSCVGILGNVFRQRENVLRSLHPTHSVAALGKDAEGFVQGEENILTPCGRNGVYGKLLDRNSQIVFIGCEMSRNTYIHGVEEWNNVPDRIAQTPIELTIIDYDGKEIPYSRYGHQCLEAKALGDDFDVSENYKYLETPFKQHGAVTYGQFGDAKCRIGDAKKMYDITSMILRKSPNIFIQSEEIPEELYV